MSDGSNKGDKRGEHEGDRVSNLSPERRKLLQALLDKERATTDSHVESPGPWEPSRGRQSAPSGAAAEPDAGAAGATGSEDPGNPWLAAWAHWMQSGGVAAPPPIGFPPPPPWAAGAVGSPGSGAFGQPPPTPGFSGDAGPRPANGPEPEKTTGRKSKILVAMKSSGSRPPFFCVHAAFGSVFPYHRLAMYMDDEQPFYGLQSPGLEGECPPLEHIGAMADLYIEEMKQVQPEGPYYLGGYSFGGWVSYEMACKLDEAGEEVGFLAILGTSVPVSVADPKIAEDVDFWLDYLEHYERLVLSSYLSDEHRMRGASFRIDNQEHLSPLAKVVQATERAQLRYLPRGYAGMLHLYLTIEQQRAFPIDHSMGWNQLCGKKVQTHLVSGNHLSMFHEPHVQDLAAQLTAGLRRAHGIA